MKKYVGFIILIGVVLAGVLGYSTIQMINARTKTFTESGFILQSSEAGQEQKVERYYFGANEAYEARYSDRVSFNDVNGDRVITSNNNFIHYTNGSISALKSGVILDLNQIENDPITYYSIAKERKVKKVGDQYIVYNLDKELQFDSFMWKISDTKYLVASKAIKLVFADGTEKLIDGFVEIEYVDNEVIKIYNQEVTYRTVSSEVHLELPNDIKLSLADRIVSKSNEPKMSLYNMVIDLNDNVPIVDLAIKEENKEEENSEENTTTGGTNTGNGSNNGGSSNSSQNNNNSNNTSGAVSNPNGETILNDVPAVKMPIFRIVSFDVTSLGFDTEIKITDEDNLLSQDTTIKIIKNSTGKSIYDDVKGKGTYEIGITVESLSPNTEYTLIMESAYKIHGDDTEYKKNFVYKIFRTSSMGISLEKDYFNTEYLSFNLKIEPDSKISSAVVAINGPDLNTEKTILFGSDTSKRVEFDVLKSDTNYNITVKKVERNGYSTPNDFSETTTYKTLKIAPRLNAEVEIDKVNSAFKLRATNIKDPNGAILSYKHELYLNGTNITAYSTATTKDNVIALVDDINVQRGRSYTYKVVYIYHDNEKIVEAEWDYPTPISMDSVAFPMVKFTPIEEDVDNNDIIDQNEDGITYESIHGNITIEDNATTSTIDFTYPIDIVCTDFMGRVVYTYTYLHNSNDERVVVFPVRINNLRSNETYKFTITTQVNLHDGNGFIDACRIGGFVLQTDSSARPMAGTFSKVEDFTTAFKIDFGLKMHGLVEENPLEAQTLEHIKIELYAGTVVEEDSFIASCNLEDEFDTQNYVSLLKTKYYDKINVPELQASLDDLPTYFTPEQFNMHDTDFTDAWYTIVARVGHDYVKYDYDDTFPGNEIPMIGTYSFRGNKIIPDLNIDDPIDVEGWTKRKVRNEGEVAKYQTIIDRADLEEEIVFQYEVTQKKEYGSAIDSALDLTLEDYNKKYENEGNRLVKSIIYKAHLADGPNKNQVVATKEVTPAANGTIPGVIFEVKDGTSNNVDDTNGLYRGNGYYFTYELKVDLDLSGSVDKTITEYDGKIIQSITDYLPKKQIPKFEMYPSTSTPNSITYKYTCNDIDQALMRDASDKAYITYNSVPTESKIEIEPKEKDVVGIYYKTADFIGLEEGQFSSRTSYKEVKSLPATSLPLANHYFESENNINDTKFSPIIENNMLVIKLGVPPTPPEEIWDSLATTVAAVDIKISAAGKQDFIRSKVAPIDNKIQINLSDLVDRKDGGESLLGSTVSITVNAYYNSGRTGFDIGAAYYTYQTSTDRDYYYQIAGSNFTPASTASGKLYTASGAFGGSITITNQCNSQNYTKTFTGSTQGVADSGGRTILPKEISQKMLVAHDGEDTAKVDLIIPEISFNVSNIVRKIDRIQFKAKINNTSCLVGDVQLRIYEIDDAGVIKTDSETKVWTPINLTESQLNGSTAIDLTDLNPKTKYRMEFWATLEDTDHVQTMVHLYDADKLDIDADGKRKGIVREFATLGDAGINNIQVTCVKTTYEDKKLVITHNMDNIEGVTKLTYILLKNGVPVYVTPVTKDSGFLNTNTTAEIEIDPGDAFEFGASYQVRIEAEAKFTYTSGEDYEVIGDGVTSGVFSIAALERPIIEVKGTRTKSGDKKIDFEFTIRDDDCVIRDNTYKVTIFQNDEITPIYKKDFPSVILVDKKIVLPDEASIAEVFKDSTYTIYVELVADINNNDDDAEDEEEKMIRSYTVIKVDDFGIGLGDVDKYNGNPDIDITFTNSQNLGEIDKVTYTVRNLTTGVSSTETVPFNSKLSLSQDGTYYIFRVPMRLTARGDYNIRMIFYRGEDLLTEEVEFKYKY